MADVEVRTFDEDRKSAIELAEKIARVLTKEGQPPVIDMKALMAVLGAASAIGMAGTSKEVLTELSEREFQFFDECRSAAIEEEEKR